MSLKYPAIVLFMSQILGCGGGGGSNNISVEPDDPLDPLSSWVIQTEIFAGEGAKNCGALSGSEAATGEMNSCMRDAFEIYQPFYATYERAGTDSSLGTGIAYDGMMLFVVHFDSISVSMNDFGYKIFECTSPRYDDRIGDTWFLPFICDETLQVEPRIN